jgi:hypothetical protein
LKDLIVKLSFFYYILLCFFLGEYTAADASNDTHRAAEMVGIIQFPVPSQGVKIYQGGTILDTELEDEHLFFRIKLYGKQNKFSFLIVQPNAIEYRFKSYLDPRVLQQTVQCRTVKQESPYAYYECIRQKDSWVIKKTVLPEDNIIPDDAIVIMHNPEYVRSLKDEGIHRLPTIIMHTDAVKEREGQQRFAQEELYYLLATIDTDTIHDRCPAYVAFVGYTKIVFNS